MLLCISYFILFMGYSEAHSLILTKFISVPKYAWIQWINNACLKYLIFSHILKVINLQNVSLLWKEMFSERVVWRFNSSLRFLLHITTARREMQWLFRLLEVPSSLHLNLLCKMWVSKSWMISSEYLLSF